MVPSVPARALDKFVAVLMTLLLIPLAFLITAWLTWRFCDPRSRLHILDVPNERSLHAHPVPRSGGIGVVTAILAGVIVLLPTLEFPAILIGGTLGLLLVSGLSFLDDRAHLPPGVRLGGHFVAAGFLVVTGGNWPQLELPGVVWEWPAALSVVVTLLFIVWMTNIYNFMDGMDGFAGGMAVFGFGGLGLLGSMAGDPAFALVAWIIAAAAAGFLVFNFPPARIFMGDVGSAGLGFLASALTLWGAQRGLFPVWAAMLLFGPFIVDATVTLIRRLLRGERIWRAHRTHYYQRLVQSGWGHRKTVLWEYGLMLLSLLGAIFAVRAGVEGQWVIILGLGAVYLAAMLWIDRYAPMPGKSDKSATIRQ